MSRNGHRPASPFDRVANQPRITKPPAIPVGYPRAPISPAPVKPLNVPSATPGRPLVGPERDGGHVNDRVAPPRSPDPVRQI